MLMLGRELRLPDQLQHQTPLDKFSAQHEFVIHMKERLKQALRQQQLEIRQDDHEELPPVCTRRYSMASKQKKKAGRHQQPETEVSEAISGFRSLQPHLKN